MKRIVVAIVICVSLSASAQSPEAGLVSIRANELREKLFHLASREMQGRGNGEPQLRVAAEYIARVFQDNRLKPAGDEGGYFQAFEMFTPRLGAANDFRVDRTVFRLGRDYVPYYFSPNVEVEAPLVFVGYGVSAPHLNFDELSGVALRGKIAVVLDWNPRFEDFNSSFNRIHPADIGSIQTKARNAYNAGAVGLIVIQNPSIPDQSIEDVAEAFSPGFPRARAPMGNMRDSVNPRLPVAILSAGAARRIFPSLRETQRRIDETLRPVFVDLGMRATLKVDVRRVSFATQNVLGLIEGRDPALRSQVVIVGAHYDHDGMFGGEIYPGADDNASGTAGLLELAEAFGNGSTAPARSILLCAFAGEEKGEVGSEHYAVHPVIPLEQTVAMIQMDMIGRNEEHGANRRLGLARETSSENANSVNVIGATFSPDVRRVIEAANGGIGLDVKFRYDDTPENLLRRSDQWAFLKNRIPSMFIHTGEHPDYHRPSDTADKINYPKLERIVRLVYLTVERIAATAVRPAFSQPVQASGVR